MGLNSVDANAHMPRDIPAIKLCHYKAENFHFALSQEIIILHNADTLCKKILFTDLMQSPAAGIFQMQ
jgi:hypothetical protein